MEEAPVPIIIKTPIIPTEANILNFTLKFNNNNFKFYLIDIDNQKLKLIANDEENEENGFFKFEAILELDILKNTNKYFKMFDNYEEFKKDFIDLCKPTNIKITSLEKNEMIITIELIIKSDNLLNITLNKVEMPQKEQLSYLVKDIKNKNKIITNLNSEIQNMKKQISSLEENVKTLTNKIEDLKELQSKFSLWEKNMNNYLSNESDIEFINRDIYLSKTEKEAQLIEIDNISFKNVGKKIFSGKDNLYFFKGEGSSEEIYFSQNLKINNRQNISLEEDLISFKESYGHRLNLQIEKPIIGQNYIFCVYIKSDQKEINMKYPLKIIINIKNQEEVKEEKLKKEDVFEIIKGKLNKEVILEIIKEKEKREKEEKEKAEKEKREKKEKEKEKREKREKDLKEKREKELKEKEEKLKREKEEKEKEKIEKEKKEKKEKEEKEKIEKREKELKEEQEKELKEKQEKELKEKQEKELKEKREKELKELKEKDLKEEKEKELKEKGEKG